MSNIATLERRQAKRRDKKPGLPLGVLLSERRPKADLSLSIPTSAWWTGNEDSQTEDPDA